MIKKLLNRKKFADELANDFMADKIGSVLTAILFGVGWYSIFVARSPSLYFWAILLYSPILFLVFVNSYFLTKRDITIYNLAMLNNAISEGAQRYKKGER